MKKYIPLFTTLILLLLSVGTFAYEDTFVDITVDGSDAWAHVFIRDGVTYAEARSIAAALNLSYEEFSSHGSVVLSDGIKSACFTPNEEYFTTASTSENADSELWFEKFVAPCLTDGASVFVPLRNISSVFSYYIDYNKKEATVSLDKYKPFSGLIYDTQLPNNLYYYAQKDDTYSLKNGGSGYCWVCSYAMVISNIKQTAVTPLDVEAVNLRRGSSGAYCYHYDIITEFGVKFVPALSKTSEFYGGIDSNSSGTIIKNPFKEDDVVRAALREALIAHPEGVMVRFADFPHTMVAVGFDNGKILFYDPGVMLSDKARGDYFSQTCVASAGFTLSDITFIQALD